MSGLSKVKMSAFERRGALNDAANWDSEDEPVIKRGLAPLFSCRLG